MNGGPVGCREMNARVVLWFVLSIFLLGSISPAVSASEFEIEELDQQFGHSEGDSSLKITNSSLNSSDSSEVVKLGDQGWLEHLLETALRSRSVILDLGEQDYLFHSLEIKSLAHLHRVHEIEGATQNIPQIRLFGFVSLDENDAPIALASIKQMPDGTPSELMLVTIGDGGIIHSMFDASGESSDVTIPPVAFDWIDSSSQSCLLNGLYCDSDAGIIEVIEDQDGGQWYKTRLIRNLLLRGHHVDDVWAEGWEIDSDGGRHLPTPLNGCGSEGIPLNIGCMVTPLHILSRGLEPT